MANSRFAYVRKYELPDPLLPGAFLVLRIDGHSFHRFSDEHGFDKPNDVRALQLMDQAARQVMEEYPDIVLAFGESDEYRLSPRNMRVYRILPSHESLYANSRFLLRRQTTLYNRRQAKIVSTLTSYFTSCYVFNWSKYFPDTPLRYPPSFDGRIVVYPTEREVRDYFAWRQADTHINNLYNTVFWALIQKGGETATQAHATLRGTVSSQKHEILFGRFDINYNSIDERFKKGSILVREEILPIDEGVSTIDQVQVPEASADFQVPINQQPVEVEEISVVDKSQTGPQKTKVKGNSKKEKEKARQTKIELVHCDIIKDTFWNARPALLS